MNANSARIAALLIETRDPTAPPEKITELSRTICASNVEEITDGTLQYVRRLLESGYQALAADREELIRQMAGGNSSGDIH